MKKPICLCPLKIMCMHEGKWNFRKSVMVRQGCILNRFTMAER